jgi:RNA-binding protein
MKRPISKRQIKRRISNEKPTIWIGKNGASLQMLAEIDRQLEKTEIVKVKVLKSALTDEKVGTIASKIAQSTKSTLIETRGHTIILYRKKNGN